MSHEKIKVKVEEIQFGFVSFLQYDTRENSEQQMDATPMQSELVGYLETQVSTWGTILG